MSKFYPINRVRPGQVRAKASELNRAFDLIERLSRLRAVAPLRLYDGPSGYHLSIDLASALTGQALVGPTLLNEYTTAITLSGTTNDLDLLSYGPGPVYQIDPNGANRTLTGFVPATLDTGQSQAIWIINPSTTYYLLFPDSTGSASANQIQTPGGATIVGRPKSTTPFLYDQVTGKWRPWMPGTMIGDSGSGGYAGMVPPPGSGDFAAGKYLDASGAWSVPVGSGMTNPMTTLGDLIYENATPAAARLAGDTSNTRKFLRTQSSGGVAQAPAWDTLQDADLPSGGWLPGMMIAYGGSSAPSNWLLCDGSTVSRTTYAALFAVIGTTYGAGNGTTTFNVPDRRGRVSVGAGTGSGLTNRVQGTTGGEETHSLNVTELAGHTHPGTGGGFFLETAGGGGVYSAGPLGQTAANTGSTGAGAGHNNMQPWGADNWIIKT